MAVMSEINPIVLHFFARVPMCSSGNIQHTLQKFSVRFYWCVYIVCTLCSMLQNIRIVCTLSTVLYYLVFWIFVQCIIIIQLYWHKYSTPPELTIKVVSATDSSLLIHLMIQFCCSLSIVCYRHNYVAALVLPKLSSQEKPKSQFLPFVRPW